MLLLVDGNGLVRCLYDEAIDLSAVGQVSICRASHVEPDHQGKWRVDLSPVDGPVLGPFDRRSEALREEQAWLERHCLFRAEPVQ